MLTFNLSICAVVRPIVGNSNNNAESAAGSTLLLVHGDLVNALPRNDAIPIARSSWTRLPLMEGSKITSLALVKKDMMEKASIYDNK